MTEEGFSYDEALAEFSRDPGLAAKWRSLSAGEPGWHETKRALEDDLIRQLKAGSLIASFRTSSAPGTVRRANIQPIWWRTADYEFDDFGVLVEIGGREYKDICIRRAVSAHETLQQSSPAALRQELPVSAPVLASSAFEARTEVEASTAAATSRKPRIPDEIGDDRLRWSRKFRVLTLDGDEMDFSGDIHFQIIDALMTGYVMNEVLSMSEILNNAESSVPTFEKAFRGSPNWPTLETILKVKKDRCWFELPPAKSGTTA